MKTCQLRDITEKQWKELFQFCKKFLKVQNLYFQKQLKPQNRPWTPPFPLNPIRIRKCVSHIEVQTRSHMSYVHISTVHASNRKNVRHNQLYVNSKIIKTRMYLSSSRMFVSSFRTFLYSSLILHNLYLPTTVITTMACHRYSTTTY